MKPTTRKIYDELFERYPTLNSVKSEIMRAFETLFETTKKNGTIYVCGNGGSAADSEHIVGELMKSFRKRRPIKQDVFNNLASYGEDGERLKRTLEGAIRTISLTSHISLSTAFANDKEPAVVFAQQLYGLAKAGDVLIAISTSGNSENCYLAAVTAKAVGISVVAMTGSKESKLSDISDVTIKVSETETYKIQELHLPVYHCLCAMLEEETF